MPKKELPVYSIQKFSHVHESAEFYANTLKKHLTEHHFIDIPHKHDFFLAVLITKGSGIHEIDFTSYNVKSGYIFLLSPGQTHNWKLSDDVDGYIFFHTKDFYNQSFASTTIQQFPFFSSFYHSPLIILTKLQLKKLLAVFKKILQEHFHPALFTKQILLSLITLVYIELSRHDKTLTTVSHQNSNYVLKLKQLELLIEDNFRDHKFPKEYAAIMNITEKHLNRICKVTLNKTTTQLIADRIILEAKRLMAQTQQTVSQIAENLGYKDNSYFARLFKKHTGETPLGFIAKYRQ